MDDRTPLNADSLAWYEDYLRNLQGELKKFVKANKEVVGWHVFIDYQYQRFYNSTIKSITEYLINSGISVRLTGHYGNALSFESMTWIHL